MSMDARITASEVIALLGLAPHPAEGGYFREVYRSAEATPADALGPRYAGARNQATAIYYLLTEDSFSAMHRLASDEIFHFYLGDPVEMLQLLPGGGGRLVEIGNDLAGGQEPLLTVPRGVWQGSRLAPRDRPYGFALLGTTVAPGFDFADYEHGERDALVAGWPAFRAEIDALTR